MNVGEAENTKVPVPVSSVIAEAKLADVGVPKKVATPDPNPVTLLNGKPVALVNVNDDGVPPAPLNNTTAPAFPGLAANAVATPVPKPETPLPIGKPVAFVNVPDVGVPKAPPFTTNEFALPTALLNAVATPVPNPDTSVLIATAPAPIVATPFAAIVISPDTVVKIEPDNAGNNVVVLTAMSSVLTVM